MGLKRFFRIPIIFVFLVLGACGPMNHKSAPSAGAGCSDGLGGGLSLQNPAAEATKFSSGKQNFIVQARFKPAQGAMVSQPDKGDNAYVIQIIRLEGLQPASKDTLVTIEYGSTDPAKPRKTAAVQRQDDGSFLATLNFKRPGGTYEIHLHVTDGSLTDDHVIPVTVRES